MLIQTASDQSVETIRRRFTEAVSASDARLATRRWTLHLFERGQKIADELETGLGSLAGKRVLELGTAYGGDLVSLYARGACCVGSDKFDFGYGRLKEYLQADGRLHLLQCDAMTRWPFADHSFDLVLAMEVLELVEDLDAFFAQMTRVLKPDGIALLETTTVLRMARLDPIYGLPLVGLLPSRVRRWVAEKVFHRGSDFRVSNHTFWWANKFKPHAARHGYDVLPMKFADSPIMARVSRWPMASLWQYLVRLFAFDFVLIVPRHCRPQRLAVS